ncbi:hypothetical protein Sste5346_009748 [Sporothrix stenoceras]|uniref:Zn(2)-C6 fungal-type domain-containing protein n=1 Tax=Sporothrix stenoceras TaxID=5173 RepID=A0ABR3YIX6_9PEZI
MPAVERSRAASATGTIHRASVACQTCRTRKVKCDAQSAPPGRGCTPCKRAGHECVLDPLSDGRRFVSRKVIDRLQQRIDALEAMNSSSTNTASSTASTTVDDNNMALSNRRFSSTTAYNSPPPSTSETTETLGRHTAHSPPEPSSSSASAPISFPIPPPAPSDDPPSFYGATSHLHVVSYDRRDGRESSHMTVFDELDAVGIDLDINSPHLRDTLLQLFFKYQVLWVTVVDKEAFFSHQALQANSGYGNPPSRWYSKFLESTMLACGARLSTSKAVRALGIKYCDWAKTEMVRAMSEPTPANLQGFLLLSEFEVTLGNNRLGWMLCGMACRMLSDLGLHKLAAHTASEQAPLNNLNNTGDTREDAPSQRECSLARDLMSACIAYEGVWTLYLGRPSSIPKSVMSVAAEYYRAYTTSATLQNTLPAHSRWLIAWVGLCLPMSAISHVLNELSLSDDERSVSLRQLSREVDVWYSNLPPELTYDEHRVINMEPAAYGLHTQYCKVQIFLRRALAGGRLPAQAQPYRQPQAQPHSQPQPQVSQQVPPSQQVPRVQTHRGSHSHRKRQRSAIVESTVGGSHVMSDSSPDNASSTSSSLVSFPTRDNNPISHPRSDSTSIYQYGFRIARLVVTYREAFGVEKIPSIMLDNAVVAATAMIGHLNNVAESLDVGESITNASPETSNTQLADLQRDTIWLRQLLVSIETVQPHFPIIGRMLESLKLICGNGPLSTLLYGSQNPTSTFASTQPATDFTDALGFGRRASHTGASQVNTGPWSSTTQSATNNHTDFGTNAPTVDHSLQPFGSFFSSTQQAQQNLLFSGSGMPNAHPNPSTAATAAVSQARGIDAVSRFGSHITSYVQDSLLTVGDCSNIGLDCFDNEIDPGFFSTAGLDDLVMDMPMSMSESLNMSHEVPEIM